MTNRTALLTQAIFVAAFIAGPSLAADDEALKKDMTAVIALQGMPCGQVVDVKVNAENDYACACKDGNRYRVYVNAAGRVVVEKQK
jgi:Tfp pilus assembly ATPase PilU